jgi:L-iditol 2-dehydrogenase
MKAILFEGKEKLRLAELPYPQCGPDEVLLKVSACGICGGDARSFFVGDKHTGKSRIPGHEVVGVVVESGQNIKEWKLGDRLALAADLHCGQCFFCRRCLFNVCDHLRILGKHVDGGLTEFMLLTRDILEHGVINRVPESLRTLHAAISEPLCSVLASHDELQIVPSETVLVLGCGPMGILHFELLRSRGARVIMVDTTSNRVQQVHEEFGGETIDASQEEVIAKVHEMTGGVGVDVVITAAPSPSAVAQSVVLVRKRGRIGVFGGLPAAQAEVSLDMNRIHYGEIRIVGNFSYHPDYHQRSLQLLADGAVRCEKLITCYPLEDTERGLYDIKNGRVLKAVVIPGSGEEL